MIAVLHDRLEMGNELIFPFGSQDIRPQLKGETSGIPNRNPWDVSAEVSEKALPNVIRFGYVNTPDRGMKKVNTRFCRSVKKYRQVREREAFRIEPVHQPSCQSVAQAMMEFRCAVDGFGQKHKGKNGASR